MNYCYLEPMFIQEPIYPGFHTYFYAYEVELKDRKVICQIHYDINYKMGDFVIVHIGQSIEIGVIVRIKLIKSNELNLQIHRLSVFDNYNYIYNNNYLFMCYILLKFRLLLKKEYPENKFEISLDDLIIDSDNKKIIIYYSTDNDKYFNFNNFIKLCLKVEKCNVEFTRSKNKKKIIKPIGDLKKKFRRKNSKLKKFKNSLEPIIEN